jgi:hypothetical protein
MTTHKSSGSSTAASGGASYLSVIGAIGAALISWHLADGSVWWAMFHAMFGWFYIIARLVFCGGW